MTRIVPPKFTAATSLRGVGSGCRSPQPVRVGAGVAVRATGDPDGEALAADDGLGMAGLVGWHEASKPTSAMATIARIAHHHTGLLRRSSERCPPSPHVWSKAAVSTQIGRAH